MNKKVKIYFNFIMYLMGENDELPVNFEWADFVFSTNPQFFNRFKNRNDILYTGKMRCGFLSKEGLKLLKKQNVSLEELYKAFMQVPSMAHYIEEDSCEYCPELD